MIDHRRVREQAQVVGLQSVHKRATKMKRPPATLVAASTRPTKEPPVAFQAEYIWIDGTKPSPLLRNKTKIVADGGDLPIWGFDGSSTEQAPGDKSDCVLRPVWSCPDPIRGGDNVLVMCEVLHNDMTPHATNTRAAAAKAAKKYAKHEPWFGIEQEYTMLTAEGRPLGFPKGGYPKPQGPYYCGVGTGRVVGRDIVEAHTQACLDAGISISGTNAEVMPGQWEFQVGPLGLLEVADQLWVARWLLHRVAEDFDVVISLDAKPEKGDWNGAGAHTNFSTKAMREDGGYKVIEKACQALGKKVMEHVSNYGHDIESRLTGKHETAPYNKFSYGVSNRGASVRIPWQVPIDGKGYLEDRRPNANMDPYLVARLLTETCCAAL
jgi:glutamine synthetase